jgi:micrococcal nuclease
MAGLKLQVPVDRVVDGDTIRVMINGKSEALRVLALDTEEVHPGDKPVTPLGRVASDFTKSKVLPNDVVTIEFPGPEPFEVANLRYRDNYGRLLVYVHTAAGDDLQELLIREGLSPYFTKYGYAEFLDLHRKYISAEQQAQSRRAGIWDQIANNGAEFRNYAALTTWWELRARIVEGFRAFKRAHPNDPPFDTRLDFERLRELARDGATTTIFTEVREFRPAGPHVLFTTGSLEQPFGVLVPRANEGGARDVMQLLLQRYVANGEERPRRSYLYITGRLQRFPPTEDGKPEMVLEGVDQLRDGPDGFEVV